MSFTTRLDFEPAMKNIQKVLSYGMTAFFVAGMVALSCGEEPSTSESSRQVTATLRKGTNARLVEATATPEIERVALNQLRDEYLDNPVRFQRDRIGTNVQISAWVGKIETAHVYLDAQYSSYVARAKGLPVDFVANLNRDDKIELTCRIAEYRVPTSLDDIWSGVVLDQCSFDN